MRTLALLFVLLWPLTAAASNPMAIEKIEVDVEIDGRLATTKVEHVFTNHSPRRIDAHFALELPDEAAITRLAMSVKDELVEGEVVPRARAREVYDGIVRSQRDPALLEWQAPGEYTLDIFPIEPGERKRVVLEYAEVLPMRNGVARYQFEPVRHELTTDLYEVTVRSKGRLRADSRGMLSADGHTVTVSARDEVAFGVSLGVEVSAAPRVWVSGRHVLADIGVDVAPEDPAARHVVLAVDRSASMPGLDDAHRIANLLAAQPHRSFRIVHGSTQVARCDAAAGIDACFAGIERRGATDLSALLGAAADEAAALDGGVDVVLVTDGGVTHGARRAADVTAPLRGHDGVALTVVAVGEQAKRGWLELLAEHGRGALVHASDPELGPAILTSRAAPRLWSVSSESDGLHDTWVGAGSRVIFTSRARRPRLEIALARGAERNTIGVATKGATRSDAVKDLWGRAKLRALEQRSDAGALERFSVEHGVMSRATSYLVLEDAAAYARHRIERRKHAERSGAHQIEMYRRIAPPRMRMARVEVSGSLDTELISRAVRSRLGAIRACYEETLGVHPRLVGMLTVGFSVERGRTVEVAVAKDDVDSGLLQDCVLDEFRTMRLPEPKGGGRVTVRYPLSFTTETEGVPSGPVATSVHVALLLREQKDAEAASLLHRELAQLTSDTPHNATLRLRLFAAQSVRDAFAAEFLDAAVQRMRHPTPPRGLATTVTLRLLEQRRVADLLDLEPPPRRLLRWLMAHAIHDVSVPSLQQLYAHWARGASATERLDAIVGQPVLEVALASDLVVAALAASTRDDEVLDAVARVATVTKWQLEAAAHIVEHCDANPPSAACVRRLRMLRGVRGVQRALERQHARRVRVLEQRRLDAPPNADELAELSELLAEAGHRERAVDIAWEIVEHAPDSDAARERAFALVQSFPPTN